MKKKLLLFAALTFCAFAANAQTKKDGTPDMRYSANQQAYGTSTPAPSYSTPSSTSSSGSYYGGGSHTTSHGGAYQGVEPGAGSSHKGGTYQNSNTGNQYGRHKNY
ncbi:MAG: hypothetical protein ACRYFZ_13420 [Janthinobacterium lividum]